MHPLAELHVNQADQSLAPLPLSDDEITYFLDRTSRTFALCIPMLPQSLHRQVGIAYLLFRVADTIEDSVTLDKKAKVGFLDSLCQALELAEMGRSSWAIETLRLGQCDVTDQHNDAELFRSVARVIASALTEERSIRGTILSHVRKSAYGMRNYVVSGSVRGNVQLKSWTELRGYCYCVAGIVGEMLTELFLKDQPSLREIRSTLKPQASSFGEALQLVNILKDSEQDRKGGRRFIPEGVPRDSVQLKAVESLEIAQQYTEALASHGADKGIVQFTQFPVMLASLTLDLIKLEGPGAKVGREHIIRILEEVGCDEIATKVTTKPATS